MPFFGHLQLVLCVCVWGGGRRKEGGKEALHISSIWHALGQQLTVVRGKIVYTSPMPHA